MMTVQLQNKGKNKEIDILLKGYFYEKTDMIENGTSLTGVLCRRGTNFRHNAEKQTNVYYQTNTNHL